MRIQIEAQGVLESVQRRAVRVGLVTAVPYGPDVAAVTPPDRQTKGWRDVDNELARLDQQLVRSGPLSDAERTELADLIQASRDGESLRIVTTSWSVLRVLRGVEDPIDKDRLIRPIPQGVRSTEFTSVIDGVPVVVIGVPP